MNQSALFFDIDGTLTNNNTGIIQQSALKAIRQARQKGHLTFINTGRTYCAIQPQLLSSPFDGFLCGCGTRILFHDQELFHYTIPYEFGVAMVEEMNACKVEGVLEGDQDLYFTHDPSRFSIVEFMRGVYRKMGLGGQNIRENNDYLYDKYCAVVDEHSDLDRFFAFIKDDMDIIDRQHGFFEIVPKGYSKATAIGFVQKHFHIALEDVYVFGDSTNDLPMFEYAKHTIAMGEHDEELEPHTEFVTKNAEDDGILHALEHFRLI